MSVNGEFCEFDDMSAMHLHSWPDGVVSTVSGNPVGAVSLEGGTIQSFKIGGQELYIDDVCIHCCGDDCGPAAPRDGQVIGDLPFYAEGDTCHFTDDYDEVCPYAGSTSPDRVYGYVPDSDVIVDISLCGASAYDTKLYVYENVCQEPDDGQEPYACNDDDCSTPSYPDPYVSEIRDLHLAAGNTYYVVVDGYGGDCGEYSIEVTYTLGDFDGDGDVDLADFALFQAAFIGPL